MNPGMFEFLFSCLEGVASTKFPLFFSENFARYQKIIRPNPSAQKIILRKTKGFILVGFHLNSSTFVRFWKNRALKQWHCTCTSGDQHHNLLVCGRITTSSKGDVQLQQLGPHCTAVTPSHLQQQQKARLPGDTADCKCLPLKRAAPVASKAVFADNVDRTSPPCQTWQRKN